MITYTYSCPIHNEFEYQHSIKENLEFCPQCQENNIQTAVKRLISKGSGFILSSGGVGWAKDNYSK